MQVAYAIMRAVASESG